MKFSKIHKSPGTFTRIACLIMAVAMAVSLVGCGVDITSVGLPTDIVLEKGETQQLNIEYGTDDKAEQEKIAEAASKLNLTWTSSDETVATVDETGLVTAVGAGEADVTVSVADANISSTTHVKVVITPTGVEAPDSIELVTNGENSKALGAKMTPEDATEVKLAYESSDENVATVDENGVVTAVADGECVITTYVTADIPATAENAEAKPVVDEVASSEAEIADSAADSAADSEVPDDAAASEPEDTTDSSFGVVPDGLSAETKVTVTTKVEQIALSKTEGVLTVGNSVTITATVTPDNATNATVNWTSSDEKVATVDSSGKVTAVAAGNATIKATSESDGDVSADYALTVNKAAAKPATRYSGTTSSAGAATTPSYTAPSAPSASTPTYVPEPAPAPAPAPAPDPAPAPAEPSQPSGGSSPDYSGSSGFDANLGSWSEGSGIDWTQGATRS